MEGSALCPGRRIRTTVGRAEIKNTVQRRKKEVENKTDERAEWAQNRLAMDQGQREGFRARLE